MNDNKDGANSAPRVFNIFLVTMCLLSISYEFPIGRLHSQKIIKLAHAQTRTNTHIHPHRHTHTHTTHTHIHIHTHSLSHTHTHTLTHNSLSHTHTHTRAQTHTHKRTHMNAAMYTCTAMFVGNSVRLVWPPEPIPIYESVGSRRVENVSGLKP